jgi:hypothetical protein
VLTVVASGSATGLPSTARMKPWVKLILNECTIEKILEQRRSDDTVAGIDFDGLAE